MQCLDIPNAHRFPSSYGHIKFNCPRFYCSKNRCKIPIHRNHLIFDLHRRIVFQKKYFMTARHSIFSFFTTTPSTTANITARRPKWLNILLTPIKRYQTFRALTSAAIFTLRSETFQTTLVVRCPDETALSFSPIQVAFLELFGTIFPMNSDNIHRLSFLLR